MKKCIVLIVCAFLAILGFKISQYEPIPQELKNIKHSYCIIDLVENENSNDTSINYIVKDLKEGRYKISFYGKEYEDGNFSREHSLYSVALNLNKDIRNLDISIQQENFGITSTVNGYSFNKTPIDFFKNSNGNIVLSTLKNEKQFRLDRGIPIGVYSMGEENKIPEKVDIDNSVSFKSNKRDLVVFIKIIEVK